MISELNRVVDAIEDRLDDDPGTSLDVAGLARDLATTEHHLRRMFSSLAGMPLSEYVRRRRMAAAAAALVRSDDDLLTIAVAHGYGSAEAFGRAFRAVHGAGPADVRRDGGPLRVQPRLRFHLTVEGSTPMDTRLADLPGFLLVGHAARVPLVHEGVNEQIAAHVAAIPAEETQRLLALNDVEPRGVLSVSDDLDPDRAEGSELTYLHGVAVASPPGDDALDAIEVDPGSWAVFRVDGPYPAELQRIWAATATAWFPSQPWRLRPGPEIVAMQAFDTDAGTAVCELWLPVEPA
ncbi:AraC family transcriptional regulator [Nocardioides sp. TRM66260-LWL]|uniref:AraC family transcriptional regulator n=1 Tax=Nocardioides sp. TRM66260-LWL TaxID=2874478 RepID=UPI001CC70971|nr:AraC family transcriptional regulator [Nocardioides sp. TRM66260-LWL]MBZ5735288.1 AraC family transcriptional regulator [Nocardioides sp. TRM66260-LWL]